MKLCNGSARRETHSVAGWSIVEILIGLTVIAFIFLISSPVINTLTQKHSMTKTSGNLLTSLTLAQEEASRRRVKARVCPSSDGSSCRADGNWNRGWLVFMDSNANSKPEASEILERYGPADEIVRIQAHGAFAHHATFNVNGAPELEGNSSKGSFRICFADGEPGFQEVQINVDGWVEARKSDLTCLET